MVPDSAREFGWLGLSAFGGPAAHVALFHKRFVEELKWLDDKLFAEAFVLGAGLPGPGSTQLAFIIALHHSGITGACAAFLAWSLPGFFVMAALAQLQLFLPRELPPVIRIGQSVLASIAVGLVSIAGWKLALKLVKPLPQIHTWIALVSCLVTIASYKLPYMTPVLILLGGLIALAHHHINFYLRNRRAGYSLGPYLPDEETLVNPSPVITEQPDISVEHEQLTSKKVAWISLGLFVGLLVICFIYWYTSSGGTSYSFGELQVFAAFYVCGGIIFGGGPVVIPLMYNYVVTPGWISPEAFLFGLTIINILPGPNFNFAAYAGGLALVHFYSSVTSPTLLVFICLLGSILGYLGIFIPGLLVKVGVWPYWTQWRSNAQFKIFLEGIASSAVGMVFSSTLLLWNDVPLKHEDGNFYASVVMSTIVLVGVLQYKAIYLVLVAAVLSTVAMLVA